MPGQVPVPKATMAATSSGQTLNEQLSPAAEPAETAASRALFAAPPTNRLRTEETMIRAHRPRSHARQAKKHSTLKSTWKRHHTQGLTHWLLNLLTLPLLGLM